MRTILVTCTVASAAPAIASVPVLARPQRLSDSLGQANDAAGYAVAAAGDLVLVGSRGADPGAQNAGKVCVFRRSGAGWIQAGSVAEPFPSSQAQFGRSLAVSEAHAVIGESVVVGDGCWIGAGAVVEAGGVLGTHVRLHPNVVVYPGVELGDRVVLHAGARVGREGFGFLPTPQGPRRIPHLGRCVLEADVEVGANSCVDRGSVDDTVIGAGTKLDNLVHVAHNVRIGRLCFLAAQVGIAGSTRIEDGVQLGGQVGISGHVTIGARASVAAQAGVIGDVPPGETWSGYPARPHREQLRAQGALARLARVIRPLERLVSRGDSTVVSEGAP